MPMPNNNELLNKEYETSIFVALMSNQWFFFFFFYLKKYAKLNEKSFSEQIQIE